MAAVAAQGFIRSSSPAVGFLQALSVLCATFALAGAAATACGCRQPAGDAACDGGGLSAG